MEPGSSAFNGFRRFIVTDIVRRVERLVAVYVIIMSGRMEDFIRETVCYTWLKDFEYYKHAMNYFLKICHRGRGGNMASPVLYTFLISDS